MSLEAVNLIVVIHEAMNGYKYLKIRLRLALNEAILITEPQFELGDVTYQISKL